MPERDVEVVNPNGIHARPAAEIVKAAGRFKAHITLTREGMEVNAKSIMGVMMLAAERGSTVRIAATGADAASALEALAAIIGSNFGEH
ncbi:MAG: HPr family phosphocarrier protein [Gemmatimonadaceae bacterium]